MIQPWIIPQPPLTLPKEPQKLPKQTPPVNNLKHLETSWNSPENIIKVPWKPPTSPLNQTEIFLKHSWNFLKSFETPLKHTWKLPWKLSLLKALTKLFWNIHITSWLLVPMFWFLIKKWNFREFKFNVKCEKWRDLADHWILFYLLEIMHGKVNENENSSTNRSTIGKQRWVIWKYLELKTLFNNKVLNQ